MRLSKYIRILIVLIIAFMPLLVFPNQALAIAQPTTNVIDKVDVYNNLVEIGDQGYLITYRTLYGALPTETQTEAYIFRLMNGVTLLSSTTSYSYHDSGYVLGIAWIYFSAATAPAWGGAFTMYLDGNPALGWTPSPVPPSVNFNAFDWHLTTSLATTSVNLTARIRYLAQQFETNWGLDLVESSSLGTVLTTEGEDYFSTTIPILRAVCPNLFLQSMSNVTFSDKIVVTDYYTVQGDNWSVTQNTDWFAQTFTPTEDYSIAGVRIRCYRVGNPGNVTASIRVTVGGIPTSMPSGVAADSASGTVNGNNFNTYVYGEWEEIPFTTQYAMTGGVTYSIIVRAIAGGVANYVNWNRDTTGSYTGGQSCSSVNSGVNWIAIAGSDYAFEVAGINVLSGAYGDERSRSLIGTIFDFTNMAGRWGITTSWLTTFITLIMSLILTCIICIKLNSGRLFGIVMALLVLFGGITGFVNFIVTIAMLAMMIIWGILYVLFFRYAS